MSELLFLGESVVRCNRREYRRERTNAKRRMERHGYMVHRRRRCCQSDMTPGLSRRQVAQPAQTLDQVRASEVAWKPHWLGGNHFFMRKVEPNHFRRLAVVKMALHRLAHVRVK